MKLRFKEDKYYNDKLIFRAGKVYEVEEDLGWAERWVRRGGEIINEPIQKPEGNTTVEPPKPEDTATESFDEVITEDLTLGDGLKTEENFVGFSMPADSTESSNDSALDALSSDEEIANEDAKVENKKGNKRNKRV